MKFLRGLIAPSACLVRIGMFCIMQYWFYDELAPILHCAVFSSLNVSWCHITDCSMLNVTEMHGASCWSCCYLTLILSFWGSSYSYNFSYDFPPPVLIFWLFDQIYELKIWVKGSCLGVLAAHARVHAGIIFLCMIPILMSRLISFNKLQVERGVYHLPKM